MMDNKKKKQAGYCCECCANLAAAGEGDFICYVCGTAIMPVSNYASAEEYLKCGTRYEEDWDKCL